MKRLNLTFLLGALFLLFINSLNAQPLPYQSAHCQDFFMSIEKGLEEEVENCLERNPGLVYKHNHDNLTPLMLASSYGHTHIMELLIKHNAPINQANSQGLYPMHFAALSGNEKAIKLLLKNKGNLSVLTLNNQSVMDCAALNGNKKLLEYVGKKDKNLYLDHDLLLAAAQGGNVNLFCQLAQKGFNKQVKDTDNNGLLHYAAQGGSVAMCEYLVKYCGFNLREENRAGQYPIETAIKSGNLQAMIYFFEAGITLNESNTNGKSWVELAKSYGWVHITQYLEKQDLTIWNLNALGECDIN